MRFWRKTKSFFLSFAFCFSRAVRPLRRGFGVASLSLALHLSRERESWRHEQGVAASPLSPPLSPPTPRARLSLPGSLSLARALSLQKNKMSRPEEQAPPDLFYNESEAAKYLQSSRMIQVQAQMAERSLEMLCLPGSSYICTHSPPYVTLPFSPDFSIRFDIPDDGTPCNVLDIGCGTGLSGETLEELGHKWVGIDISRDMLRVAKRREVEGDLLEGDMGHGLPFRQGVFDGAISISAVQVFFIYLPPFSPYVTLPFSPYLRMLFDFFYSGSAIQNCIRFFL